MQTDKILLVWYSRTGATRSVAAEIARQLRCEAEELVDRTNRHGVVGWVRGLIDAVLKRLTIIDTVHHTPADFDVVIIGTPVWAGSLPPAIRTYLTAHRPEFPRVAFFCTSTGRSTQRVFEEMARLSGRAPDKVLVVHGGDIPSGLFSEAVPEFVADLRRSRTAA